MFKNINLIGILLMLISTSLLMGVSRGTGMTDTAETTVAQTSKTSAGAPQAAAYSADRPAAGKNPLADPAAMVIWKQVRITVLTSQLLRLEWSANSKFNDAASLIFINRNLPVPGFGKREEKGWHILTTDALELRYKKDSGKFNPDNLKITLRHTEPEITWKPGTVDSLNLLGTTRTLDETEGEGTVKLDQGILSRSGWAVVDDSKGLLFDNADPAWVTLRAAGEQQDWYFFGYGHEYKKALYDYTQVAGKIPLPPRFAMGYWWSHYWTYSDSELRELVDDFKQHNLPLDVLVMDMDWHETYGLSLRKPQFDAVGERVGWTGYTWNNTLFPEPKAFLDWVHNQGIKVALNLHPASGVTPQENKYKSFVKEYRPEVKPQQTSPYTMEDKKWAQTYFETIIHPLEKDGVDFWWLDWQAWKENKQIPGLNNTWWLNHVFFTDMQRQGKARPLLFHRWGGLGNHRYQIGFSGDTRISWKSLAYQPYFTATAGNVGYGYWSHDIGGHMGEPTSPELYLRWLQFGALSPIFRTHATKSSELERRIWMYPKLYAPMREAMLLRHALTPYLYTQARKTYDTGISICRPLYWEYPNVEAAYHNPHEYFLGDDIIVAPITAPANSVGLSRQKVWLPEGTWYDRAHGKLLDGKREYTLDYALNEIPIFVKSGAIIPCLPATEKLSKPFEELSLDIYPGADRKTTLYTDEGNNEDYQSGKYAITTLITQRKGNSLFVRIPPTKGSYHDQPDFVSYQINLIHSLPPSAVKFTDLELPYSSEIKPFYWTYNGKSLTVSVLLPQRAIADTLECEFIFSPENKLNLNLLESVPGGLNRLPGAIKLMKNEVNRVDPFANIPQPLQYYGSMASRLNYHPETAVQELQSWRQNYPELLRSIVDYDGGDLSVLTAVTSLLSYRQYLLEQPLITLSATESDSAVIVTITPNRINAELQAGSNRINAEQADQEPFVVLPSGSLASVENAAPTTPNRINAELQAGSNRINVELQADQKPFVVLPSGSLASVENVAPTTPNRINASLQAGSNRINAELQADQEPFVVLPSGSLASVDNAAPTTPNRINAELQTGNDLINASLQADTNPGSITLRYTLDGSIPTENSPLYAAPFRLSRMAVITARAFPTSLTPADSTADTELLPSFPATATFHYNWAKSVAYKFPPASQYSGSGALALVDGSYGQKFDFKQNWVGFEQNDGIITIAFRHPLSLREISARFLRDQSVWIFHPLNVRFELSSDGKIFEPVLTRDLQTVSASRNDEPQILTINSPVATQTKFSFLRVSAQSINTCPPWHRGAGGKAWVFLDEIVIDGE